jgi:hypothetical protein
MIENNYKIYFFNILIMENNIVTIYVDLIFNIILCYYKINEDLNEDPVLEFHIISFLKQCLFKYSYEKFGYCLIQEFDKINFSQVNNDVFDYKFKEKDRILISQFANKIHFYIEKKNN